MSAYPNTLLLRDWAQNYLNIGYHLAELPSSDRWVLAVSVPTKVFVSPLIAAGFSLNYHRINQRHPFEMETHIAWLRSLPVNTQVRYIERPSSPQNHRSLHKFKCISETGGKVCVVLEKGGATITLGISKFHLIRDVNFAYCRDSFTQLDFVLGQLLSRKSSSEDTLRYLFPGKALGAIVGNTGRVAEEVEYEIGIKMKSNSQESIPLKNLLGVGQRCHLFANSSAKLVKLKEADLSFLIFENLSMAEKYSFDLNPMISIHILDRSKKDFLEYRDWIYRQFINRSDSNTHIVESAVPSVEFLLFSNR